ncbi:MAG: hypothetical protein ACR2QT_09790 [Woeseiaceae bacterium]
MTLNRSRIFQTFKYTVYAFLAFNVYVFFAEEHAAAKLQFSDGVALLDMIEAYASTIDTAAWVVLLLMFELETFVLEDHHYTKSVTWTLQLVRMVCYAFIIYSFYGYVVNLTFLNGMTPLTGVDNLCSLAGQWSYGIDHDEYMAISAVNCGSLSPASSFLQFPGMNAVVDAQGFADIRMLSWVDVINSAVWLLVVLVLEVDVRLQERNRFEGTALRVSNALKVVLYSILFLAAIYWGFKGDFVDFWDAFLWLVAFFFIELNVVEWRKESAQTEAALAAHV